MITIIVPFYNTEKYLKECLLSIKNQLYIDYECLMIDDGSTDASRKIAEEFLDDSRFKLLGNKHIGFPLSKNLGLDNAKGEYILIIEPDDLLLNNILEKSYLKMELVLLKQVSLVSLLLTQLKMKKSLLLVLKNYLILMQHLHL